MAEDTVKRLDLWGNELDTFVREGERDEAQLALPLENKVGAFEWPQCQCGRLSTHGHDGRECCGECCAS